MTVVNALHKPQSPGWGIPRRHGCHLKLVVLRHTRCAVGSGIVQLIGCMVLGAAALRQPLQLQLVLASCVCTVQPLRVHGANKQLQHCAIFPCNACSIWFNTHPQPSL
jgi:hypothetical protein